ncbi:MAG: class II aldolase/adducin family protein [Alphaproteobacteria bacterium]|nr:class II aldolase/adducin family protein [Alphaproteobacteria bacterium]
MSAALDIFDIPSMREQVSEEEWQARVELAAAYRLTAHFGWTHLVNNHISLRLPGTKDHFLINPYGFLYEQITASSLLKIDCDGNLLQDSDFEVNRAGFVIHSAIHMSCPDLHCVFHTHTVGGQAVSALECGLLPLNQGAMRFYNRVGYHDFEGIARDLDERDRLVQDLGPHKVLILRNHGLLTAGVNVGEAFHFMYHLEKSCQTQMQVLASNMPYTLPSEEACEKAASQFWRPNRVFGARDWPALVKLADQLDPSYRD